MSEDGPVPDEHLEDHRHDDRPEDHRRDAALDAVLIGGREERLVVLAEADARWPAVFERHRAAIAEALGERARRIDHVGSTSVPGLAAKPIIDIQLTVDDPEDDDAYQPALVALGYELRVREPRHRMFRTPGRDIQVHVWAAGSHDERRHVLFRDWLRVDDADRTLYEETKRRLAGRRWRDVNYYAEAKSPVIDDIMARAESWAAREGWTLQ